MFFWGGVENYTRPGMGASSAREEQFQNKFNRRYSKLPEYLLAEMAGHRCKKNQSLTA